MRTEEKVAEWGLRAENQHNIPSVASNILAILIMLTPRFCYCQRNNSTAIQTGNSRVEELGGEETDVVRRRRRASEKAKWGRSRRLNREGNFSSRRSLLCDPYWWEIRMEILHESGVARHLRLCIAILYDISHIFAGIQFPRTSKDGLGVYQSLMWTETVKRGMEGDWNT